MGLLVAVTEGLARYGRPITEEQCEKLEEFRRLLYMASTKTNLIALRDREELAIRHILPSLNMAVPVSLLPHRTILDFGSGAGIPGIPLKILLPQSRMVLVESRRKRANFLRDVVRRLELHNTEILNARLEEVYRDLAGTFDLVVTRAAITLPCLWACVAPVLKDHGAVIATLDTQRGFQSGVAVILRKKNEEYGRTHWYGILR